MSQSNTPPGDHYHLVNMCCKTSLEANQSPLGEKLEGFSRTLIYISCIFQDAVCCEILISGTEPLPPDWMLTAGVHIWAWGRGRKGAEVE